jgi:hypothetical protein
MLHLTLKAHPGARDERVSLLPDGRLDIRVRAPACVRARFDCFEVSAHVKSWSKSICRIVPS